MMLSGSKKQELDYIKTTSRKIGQNINNQLYRHQNDYSDYLKIVRAVWHDDDDPPDMTAPSDSGFTSRHDAQDATGGNGFGMGVGDEFRATQGSTGDRTWTLTELEERSGIMLSINASGTGNYTLDQEVQFTNIPGVHIQCCDMPCLPVFYITTCTTSYYSCRCFCRIVASQNTYVSYL